MLTVCLMMAAFIISSPGRQNIMKLHGTTEQDTAPGVEKSIAVARHVCVFAAPELGPGAAYTMSEDFLLVSACLPRAYVGSHLADTHSNMQRVTCHGTTGSNQGRHNTQQHPPNPQPHLAAVPPIMCRT